MNDYYTTEQVIDQLREKCGDEVVDKAVEWAREVKNDMKIEIALEEIEKILRQIDPMHLYQSPISLQLQKLVQKIRRDVEDEVLEIKKQEQEKRREAQQKIELRAILWCKANLKPGMYIKVVGTRDGTGIRKVLEINMTRQEVTCRQISGFFNRDKQQIGVDPIEIIEEPRITQHLFKKVRGEVVPETGDASHRWHRVRWKYVNTLDKDSV